MNPKHILTGSSAVQAERPPTEIESELNESRSIANQLQDLVASLEERLQSVTSQQTNAPDDKATPQAVLVPLADAIRKITDQHRVTAYRLQKILDNLQTPYL